MPADVVLKAMNVVHRALLRLSGGRVGDERHPDWFLNLRAQPQVEVALQGGPRRPMVARTAEGPERERLWGQITASNPRYAAYQRKTAREIPVVVLDPAVG